MSPFPDDVLNYISNNITSNIRDLEKALTKLCAYTEFVKKNLTIEIAQEQLKDLLILPVEVPVTVEKVQKVVADYFNISINDLKGTKRTKAVTMPRQIAMYILRKITDMSTTEIGQRFGGRDHTTVMHSCRKIEEKFLIDPTLQPLVNELIRSIKEG